MKSDTGKSSFFQAEVLSAPTALNDVVRKTDMDAAISGTSPAGHTHSVSQVTDFADQWRTRAANDLEDSDTVTTASGTAVGSTNKRRFNVKLKASGGLKSTSAGTEIDFGPSGTQAAPGNHTHAQLHDPLSVTNGQSVTFSLNGQALSAEVRLRASGGLISTAASGVEIDFGTGANQAARGNHTHTQLHTAVTGANSNSIALSVVSDQVVSGSVRRKPDGGVLEDSDGIYLDVGTSAQQVAAGDHTHPLATTLADGLLSAADKGKIDAYGAMLQVDQSVLFTRHDVAPAGSYVGGRHRWGQAMQLIRWHATADAPIGAPILLGLELNGTVVDTIELPADAPGVEVFNSNILTDQHLAADFFARVVVVSGVGAIENEASRINVGLEVRPSLATAPTVRIDSGGGSPSGLFGADAFYDGGATTTTSIVTNVSGVSNPAPVAVYQSVRYRVDSTNLNYLVTGLAKGIPHTVRLHFNEFLFSSIGQRVMRITVGGTSHPDLDILSKTSGVQHTAWIEEYASIMPDANGRILITLMKIVGGVVISGFEVIPEV